MSFAKETLKFEESELFYIRDIKIMSGSSKRNMSKREKTTYFSNTDRG